MINNSEIEKLQHEIAEIKEELAKAKRASAQQALRSELEQKEQEYATLKASTNTFTNTIGNDNTITASNFQIATSETGNIDQSV